MSARVGWKRGLWGQCLTCCEGSSTLSIPNTVVRRRGQCLTYDVGSCQFPMLSSDGGGSVWRVVKVAVNPQCCCQCNHGFLVLAGQAGITLTTDWPGAPGGGGGGGGCAIVNEAIWSYRTIDHNRIPIIGQLYTDRNIFQQSKFNTKESRAREPLDKSANSKGGSFRFSIATGLSKIYRNIGLIYI